MSRWRSIWLVARREILERGRSRGFILSVAVHDAARGRLVRRAGRPVRRREDDTGRRRPARPAGPTAHAAAATQFDRKVEIAHLPRRGRG